MASHRQKVIDLVRDAAIAVNYSGTFLNSSRNQLSLYTPEDPAPYIHLFNDFRLERISNGGRILNSSLRRTSLLITFLYQDTQESTPEQQEAIMEQAETLCDAFVLQFQDDGEQQVEAVSTEPVYRLTAGILTGVSLTMTIVVDVECS